MDFKVVRVLLAAFWPLLGVQSTLVAFIRASVSQRETSKSMVPQLAESWHKEASPDQKKTQPAKALKGWRGTARLVRDPTPRQLPVLIKSSMIQLASDRLNVATSTS